MKALRSIAMTESTTTATDLRIASSPPAALRVYHLTRAAALMIYSGARLPSSKITNAGICRFLAASPVCFPANARISTRTRLIYAYPGGAYFIGLINAWRSLLSSDIGKPTTTKDIKSLDPARSPTPLPQKFLSERALFTDFGRRCCRSSLLNTAYGVRFSASAQTLRVVPGVRSLLRKRN